MTDRVQSLTVVLDKDYREDDVKEITNAISLIRGVLHVTNANVDNVVDYVARTRARTELAEKLWAVLYPKD